MASTSAYQPPADLAALKQQFAAAVATPEPLALARVTAAFEAHPAAFSVLYPAITTLLNDGRATPPVARWAADLMQTALCRPLLSADDKASLARNSLDAITRLLSTPDVQLQKAGLQCFASIYPLLFKHVCAGADQQLWAKVVTLKGSALQLYRVGAVGSKLVAIKVLQRIIQTQTKGTADPRLQRTAEPNLSLCRASHPFLRIGVLEDEANKLLEEAITTLFTSPTPDIISAIALTLSNLVKTRPAFANLIITALSNWTPAALAGQSNTQVRSVEKTIRISLTHLLKTAHANAFAAQVTQFLGRQAARMEQAAIEAGQQREQEASRKRQSISDDLSNSAKRRRLDPGVDTVAALVDAGTRRGRDNALATFDATTLPLQLAVDLIIASFQALGPETLAQAISDARRNLPDSEATALPPTLVVPVVATPVPTYAPVKSEPLDPLQLDLGDEELDLKAVMPPVDSNMDEEADDDAGPQGVGFELDLADISADLVAPQLLSATAKTAMIESALRRICIAGSDGTAPTIWAPLVSRLITRGLNSDEEEGGDELALDRQESLRRIMFDFVVADLQSRMEFARLWLNEEWFVDGCKKAVDANTQAGLARPYDRWLRRLLEHILEFSSNKDKSFSQFMVDLPEVPSEEIVRLGEMCTNPDQVQLGFSALRDLATLRPVVRREALDVLLALTTHSDRLTRNAAINTVKRWVPDSKPLGESVTAFALALLSRLEIAPPPASPTSDEALVAADGQVDEVDVKVPAEPVLPYALVKNGLVVDRLPPASTLAEVVQHVELLLALCVKSPELLDHLFDAYPRLQPLAQESLLSLITPVIRSLGAKPPNVAHAIETCPAGAEPLALCILNLLIDKGRLPAPLIASVKVLATRRELSPRFYVWIIGDCGKAEIVRYLPRIVSLLNNTPQEKAIVRSAFLSVLATPSQSFSRKSELLTPVELMTLLHRSEKEVGLKNTIEAVAICFSMPDAFRPEVLAAFMQQVVDEQVLPVLFLRTVIQAVTTYKSLQPFVSTTLLSRLIARKVWTTAPLWEGFIRCAKVIAPHSFAALLQLPKEQLMDVVAKQPTLRSPLREWVKTKAGGNKARSSVLLEALGESDSEEPSAEEGGMATGDEGGEGLVEPAASP